MLYVGNIKPHKNVERLVDAFHLARQGGLDRLRLVVIGDELSKNASLRRAVHRYNLHKHVRFLGFLPDETLSAVYRLASVFVFPSLYEGFGLPPLEAMACGTPVVTSNVSSLPEVTGDAALLVDPTDASAIAAAITRVVSEPALREELRARGLARARQFSWERSVKEIRDIYLQVAAAVTRVALVHDWLTGMRGGEKALEALADVYPEADIFTLVYQPAQISPGINRHAVRTSFLNHLPGIERWYRHFLPVFPVAVELFDLDGYDLVVSTSHCAAKAVIAPGRARHVCYCFTPMRYAWDQFDHYFGPERLGTAGSALARPVLAWLARWDAATAQPRQPLCGYFTLCCRQDRPIL